MTGKGHKKPIGKTVVFGLGTIAAYVAVFTNAASLTELFSRGAWYAAGPIATVFVISYLHGGFAHNLWASLGVEASKKVAAQVKTAQKRKDARPRAVVQA